MRVIDTNVNGIHCMELLKRYFVRLAIWSTALFEFLFMAGSGSDIWSSVSRMPALACFAMILACFPAGLSIGAGSAQRPSRWSWQTLHGQRLSELFSRAESGWWILWGPLQSPSRTHGSGQQAVLATPVDVQAGGRRRRENVPGRVALP